MSRESLSMRESLKRSLLIVASLLVGLMALEIGLRASTWGYLFTWPNFVLDARTVLARQDSGRYVHDDRVGYVPRAGYSAPGLIIDSDGLRHTGEQTADAPILAVGDSFTFGAEVNDGQTWPAQLKLLTGRRVLNGGVSGYGFDGLVRNTGVAVDPSGNVWLCNNWKEVPVQANPGGYEMVVYVGVAGPVTRAAPRARPQQTVPRFTG